ncbi:unnamed protein product [Nippostrongylus brasiliensis]|uniref:Reverse transcriptase domain-containing protein n=1 Tax=Nippostrongylus brasiliensis TaxID=27835 RepID=A0A0N4XQM5_NIPBR|nr:unnamed protein product [Nippostrongylus brasiliensis]
MLLPLIGLVPAINDARHVGDLPHEHLLSSFIRYDDDVRLANQLIPAGLMNYELWFFVEQTALSAFQLPKPESKNYDHRLEYVSSPKQDDALEFLETNATNPIDELVPVVADVCIVFAELCNLENAPQIFHSQFRRRHMSRKRRQLKTLFAVFSFVHCRRCHS